MTDPRRPLTDRLLRTFSSLRTGIILLILLGISAAAGTLILQRPITDPEQMARAYAPQTLVWLDRTGLTDVFHSWWFIVLMALLCANIILASLERLPGVWRQMARPYRRPEAHFLSGLPMHVEIPVRDARQGVEAATRAFHRLGLKPQRVGEEKDASLFAERHRVARLAAYVVHVSLLLILVGGMVDGIWGYRGFVALTQGEQASEIELRDGTVIALPFAVRCDGAGQENYPDGTPQRWWSKLVVLEDGQEVKSETIEVNKPLVHRGLRFFQSSYGLTGQPGAIHLTAQSRQGGAAREITLWPGQNLALDPQTNVHLANFVPDFIVANGQIASRSNQINNPAIQLCVERAGTESKVWLFPRFPDFAHPDEAPYAFQYRDLEMGYFTGLQVAYEPGQWAVWAGVILMGTGLFMAFYLVHMRFWAVPVDDGRGRLVLWVGANASKNREEFEERFTRLVAAIQDELEAPQETHRAPEAHMALG